MRPVRAGLRVAAVLVAGPSVLFLAPSRLCAEDLQAVHPGVMCKSAEALAKLTRHDGSSRADGASPDAGFTTVKAQGTCVDLVKGDHVTVMEARHNTSVVRFAGRFGAAGGTYIIPNIDFAPMERTGPAGAPPGPDAQAGLPPPLPSYLVPAFRDDDLADVPGPVEAAPHKPPAANVPTAPPDATAAPASKPPSTRTGAVSPASPRTGAESASSHTQAGSSAAIPTAAPAPGTPAIDVTGLRLGMTVAEAGRTLNPDLTIQPRNLSDPARSATAAYTTQGRGDGDTAYEAYLLEFLHGHMAYIQHAQVFAAGSEPLDSEVAAALKKKYGERSGGRSADLLLDWSLDADGRKLTGADAAACRNPPSDRVPLRGLVPDGGSVDYDAGLVPRAGPAALPGRDVHKICGRILYAQVEPDPRNTSLVRKLTVTLFDAAPFFALDQEREAALLKKNQDAEQASKANQIHL